MVLDPIPQSLPVHFFGSRPQPPTSHWATKANEKRKYSGLPIAEDAKILLCISITLHVQWRYPRIIYKQWNVDGVSNCLLSTCSIKRQVRCKLNTPSLSVCISMWRARGKIDVDHVGHDLVKIFIPCVSDMKCQSVIGNENWRIGNLSGLRARHTEEDNIPLNFAGAHEYSVCVIPLSKWHEKGSDD